MKKLRADCAHGMSVTIPRRIFCLTIYYKKYKHSNIQTQGSSYCFVWVRNVVSHIERGTKVEDIRECGRGLGGRKWRNLRNAEFLPFIPYQILLG